MLNRKSKQPPADSGRRRPVGQPDEKRPQAFSYHANRSVNREPVASREVSREPTVRDAPSNWRWWLVLLGTIVAFMAVSVQSTTPKVTIQGSDAARQLLQAPSVYESYAAEQLNAPQNHVKYLTDTNALATTIRKQFPELTAVVVSESLLSPRPTIIVAGYEPAIIINSTDGSYVVDDTGVSRVASARVPEPVRANLPTIVDQSGLPLEPGNAVLPSNDITFILTTLATLKAANISYDNLLLPAAASELDVKITGQTYTVRFAMQGGADARQQVGTFLAAQARVGGAQYVDVRVPERLYYK